MNTQILTAVLFAIKASYGPVTLDAWKAAHDAGFLFGGQMSFQLKAAVALARDNAYEANLPMPETSDVVRDVVAATFSFRRFDMTGEL